MKKNFKLFAVSAAVLLTAGALASCGEGGSGPSFTDEYSGKLTYSGPESQEKWVRQVAADYNAERKAQGIPEIKFEFVQHGEDKVDSEVTDWSTGPDVYAFASDKVMPLFQAGALATISGIYKDSINNTMTDAAIEASQFAGRTVSYPYAGDNGYFLFYNKSLVTAEDCATIEGLMNKAASLEMGVAYPLNTAFYSAGALFTYGAGYDINVDDSGKVQSIEATFNTAEGLKAGKAIYQIMKHSAYVETQAAPIAANKLVACIDGSWNVSAYQTAMGDDFACMKLPTVTVDGETKNLSSYLGYKMLGVNPLVSVGNTQRLLAAHNFARYLSSKEVQEKRFDTFGIAPTNKEVFALDKVTSSAAIKAIGDQAKYAVPQTAVPGNIWTAPQNFTQGIKDGTITLENMEAALETLNASIEASK